MNTVPFPSNAATARVREPQGPSPALRHRILQADGRRYSINIEESYWAILERLADRRGMRLSKLIQSVASHLGEESSLAANLRLLCLQETVAELRELEHRHDEHKRTSGPNYVECFVEANPSPTLLIGADRRIQRLNAAFVRWSKTPPDKLVGENYEWFFQIRAGRPLPEIQAQFVAGSRESFAARISYIAPGRVVVANVKLCLMARSSPKDYSWGVLIEGAAPVLPAQAKKPGA